MKTRARTPYYFAVALVTLVLIVFFKGRQTDQPAPVTSATTTAAGGAAALDSPNQKTSLAKQPRPAPSPGTKDSLPPPPNGRAVDHQTDVGGSDGGRSTSKPMQAAEFERLTKQALETLPKKSDVRKAPKQFRSEGTKSATSDAHHLSPEVIAKIQVLADVVEAVDGNPDLEVPAISFYQSCAQSADFLVAVRARCLAHLKTLADKHNQPVDLDKYPPDVQRLANYIP